MKLPLLITAITNFQPRKHGELWFTGRELKFRSVWANHSRNINQVSEIALRQYTTPGLEDICSIDLLVDKGDAFIDPAFALKLDGNTIEHRIITDSLLQALKLPPVDWDACYRAWERLVVYKR